MQTNSKARGLMTSEEYLEDLIRRVNSGQEESLRKINAEVTGLTLISARKGDAGQVDYLMEKIDLTTANPVIAAILLRSSLRLFPYLKNWIPLRDRVLIALNNFEDVDGKSLMLNLDKIDITYQPPTELDGLLQVHSNFRK